MTDGPDPQLLERAGWTPEELFWEELSEAALALPPAEAAPYWREAAEAARLALAPEDARQATALANLALAETLTGRATEARALLEEAARRWQAAAPWVEALAPERRARSSLFHLRLQRKHPGGYDHWSRERYAALYEAGREALARRLAGSYRPEDPLAAWRHAKPEGFEDARRLLAARYLIAPDLPAPPALRARPPGER